MLELRFSRRLRTSERSPKEGALGSDANVALRSRVSYCDITIKGYRPYDRNEEYNHHGLVWSYLK